MLLSFLGLEILALVLSKGLANEKASGAKEEEVGEGVEEGNLILQLEFECLAFSLSWISA